MQGDKMDTQVKLVFESLNGGILPAIRTIVLDPDNDQIQIGRASKSVSKGLHSLVNNAWFDSPVMSRDHAQVSLAVGNTIYLEDIGSMHGTLLNDSKLAPHTPRQLENGDVVVFGAEVKRGHETFPACSFRINYEATPFKSANTFTFPESSDVEDEEDYDFSDDDTDKRHESSEDGASIEQSPKISQGLAQPIPSIEIIQDDSPVVDLTVETAAEMRIMGLMAGRPIDIDEDADHVSIGVYAGNAPILIESESDIHADFSSDSDDQSDGEDSSCSGLSEGYHRNGEGSSDVDDKIYENEDEECPMEDDQDQVLPALNNITRFAIATHENPTLPLREEPGSVIEDNDEIHEVGQVENGSEDLRALFDEDIDVGEEEVVSMKKLVKSNEFTTSYYIGPAPVARNNIFTPTFQPDWSESAPLRQPSPSDAAMVKGVIQTSVQPFVSMQTVGEPGLPCVANSFADAFGKTAFFNARAANKLTFQTMDNQASSAKEALQTSEAVEKVPNTQADGFHTFPFSQRACMNISTSADFSRDFRPARGEKNFERSKSSMFTPRPSSNAPLPEKVSTRENCPFLDKPDQNPIFERVPSPLPDMTSAVSYNQSKERMAIIASESHRASINVIDNFEKSSRKRGAHDISNTTERELATWGSCDPSAAIALRASSPPQSSSFTSELATPDHRPSKRLKKTLEKLGYMALGGVAVGAGLFSALVATAPDYL